MRDFDNPQYDSGLSFLDMLFIYLLAFAMLLVLALLLIRPPTEAQKDIKLRAEFVLTMTWPDGSLDDIDMWVMLPDGRKVNYRNKDVDYVTLDRDDLGALSDIYTDGNGQRQLTRINREMVTIRAIVPGRYVVAAHVYAVHAGLQDQQQPDKTWAPDPPLPYEAGLELVKLNPRTKEILRAKVQLNERAQESVFAAFEVDAEGNVSNIELNPAQYKIVDLVPLFGTEAVR